MLKEKVARWRARRKLSRLRSSLLSQIELEIRNEIFASVALQVSHSSFCYFFRSPNSCTSPEGQLLRSLTSVVKLNPHPQTIWDIIADIWEAIRDFLRDAWADLWWWLRFTFYGVVEGIRSWISLVASWIRNKLHEIGSWIYGQIERVQSAFWTFYEFMRYWWWPWLINLPAQVSGWFRDLRERIANQLAAVISWIRDKLHQIGGWIKESIYAAGAWVRDKLHEIGSWIRDGILQAFGWVRDKLTEIGHWIREVIREAVGWVRDKLWQVWEAIVGGLRDLGTRLWQNLVNFWNFIVPRIREIFERIAEWIEQRGAAIWRSMMTRSPEVLQELTAWWQNFADSAARGLSALLSGMGPAKPETAFARGIAAFALASGFGMSAHFIASLTELLHPVKWMGLHYVSGFLAHMGSFSMVSNSLMGPYLRASVSRPLEYFINQQLRPTIPPLGEVLALRRKYAIDMDTFRLFMSYHGISDELIENYLLYLPSDPRLYDILRMADVYIPPATPTPEGARKCEQVTVDWRNNPNWWYELKFKLAGYDDVDVPQLIKVVHARLEQRGRARLRATSGLFYRRGYAHTEWYKARLRESGATPADIELFVQAEDIAHQADYVHDMILLYEDMFIKEQISEGDFALAIHGLVPRMDRAELIIKRAKIRKIPRPARKVDKELERAKREMQKLYLRLYREQFRKGLITAKEYRANLIALGLTEDYADVVVALEKAKLVKRPKVIPPALYDVDNPSCFYQKVH